MQKTEASIPADPNSLEVVGPPPSGETRESTGNKLAIELSRMEFKRYAKIVRRGEMAYDAHVRPKLRPEDEGRFVAIDLDTGEFEIHTKDDAAVQTLRKRRPTANIWLTTVGPVEVPRVGVVGQ